MNNDADMRAFASARATPVFAEDPWVPAPDLAEATVAICTTAGLHVSGDRGWAPDADPTFKL